MAIVFSIMLLVSPMQAQRTSGALTYDGRERSYDLYVPASYDDSTPVPLVMVLHGGGGDSRNMAGLTRRRFNELADRDGFIVVYPNGVDNHWNDGRQGLRWRAHRENIDDVGFLLSLVDHLGDSYTIDRDRVYSTGISNGGHMSFRLACEATDRIAGVGIVAANLTEDLHNICAPSSPVPVIIINGTDDPLIPWEGGTSGLRRAPVGEVLSADDTRAFWLDNNGCATEPTSETLASRPFDGTAITHDRYTDCRANGDVSFYTVENGGHTWPGGVQYLPRMVIGNTSREIDAADEIWAFFQAHSR